MLKACRGTKKDNAVKNEDKCFSTDVPDADNETVEEKGVCAVTPSGADFLACYATTNGECRGLFIYVCELMLCLGYKS